MRNRPDRDQSEGIQAILIRGDGSLLSTIGPQMKEMGILTRKGSLSPEETARVQELSQSIAGALAGVLGIDASRVVGITGTPSQEITQESLDKFLGLENIILDGTIRAAAIARLFKGPWDECFAHGPDTLLPVAGLAEKILKPGEKLQTLGRISWRSIMTNDLDLRVSEGELSDSQRDGCTLDGFFETDQGRKLSFFANQIADSPIRGSREANPIASGMICNCEQHLPKKGFFNTIKAQLIYPDDLERMIDLCEKTAGFKFATLADLIARMLAHFYETEKQCERLQFMAGINDLILPDSLEDITRKGEYLKLEIRKRQARIGRSGLKIVPFDFKFPHQKRNGTGIVANGNSDEIEKKLLEIATTDVD